jgi:hypothetical protein
MHRGSYGSAFSTIQEPGSPVDARVVAQLASPPMTAQTDPNPIAALLSRRSYVAATVVVLFLVWQLAMPTAALFGPRPERFGWQMYSAFPELPKAWTIDAKGAETSVEVKQFFGQLRAEIDFAAALRAGLCDATGAVAVRVADPRGTTEVIECR